MVGGEDLVEVRLEVVTAGLIDWVGDGLVQRLFGLKGRNKGGEVIK